MEIIKRMSPEWFEVDHAGEKLGFLLSPLTGAQVINIQQAGAQKMGDALLLAVEYGVQDWRGITEGGESVKVTSARRAAVFADAVLLSEVGTEIIRRARLSEKEAKN